MFMNGIMLEFLIKQIFLFEENIDCFNEWELWYALCNLPRLYKLYVETPIKNTIVPN